MRWALGWLLVAAACSGDGAGAIPTDAGDPDAPPGAETAGPDVRPRAEPQGPAGAPHCPWEAVPPQGGLPVAPGPLVAGAAEGLLDLPLGTPLGGYLGRSTTLLGGGQAIDGRGSPFARQLVPSAGIQTRIPVRAVVLQAGDETVFLVKVDVPLLFDGTLFSVEEAVSERTGLDARGRVVLVASHSHSGYGRLSGHFLYQQGMDLWLGEAVDGLVEAAADVVGRAWESRGPARIGLGIQDGWDPDDRIYRDRRPENDALTGGEHKDGRLSLLRVDRADGHPLALVYGFGMHGTIGEELNPYVSVDATGHVDLELEERFDEPVVVLHLQGAAGDASPAGVGTVDDACTTDEDCHGLTSVAPGVACDGGRCRDVVDFGRMESLGERAAPRILALWEATASTAAEVALEIVTRTVPSGSAVTVGRPWGQLAYLPHDPSREPDGGIWDALGRVATPLDEFNVPFGAFGCGGEALLATLGIPGTADLAPYRGCVDLAWMGDFAELFVGLPAPQMPLCETLSTTLSALRITPIDATRFDGESASTAATDLAMAFLPGEPTALLTRALRERSPAGPDATWVVGYAQDYKGYLLTVEDWLQGGYEPSISVWGPLEGESFLEAALALVTETFTPEREEAGAASWRPVYGEPPRLARESDPTPEAGSVAAAIPDSLLVRLRRPPASAQPEPVLSRITGRALFVWEGGDPQIDPARVVLERLGSAGGFEPVLRRSGRPVDDRGKELFLTYTPVPLEAVDEPRRHLYAAEWQAVAWEGDAEHPALEDFAGVPAGTYRLHARGRSRGADGEAEYDVASDAFDVVPAVLELIAVREEGEVVVSASYPAGPGFRLLDLEVPSNGPVPLRGTATVELIDAGGTVLSSATPPGVVQGIHTTFAITADPQATAVRVVDLFGNVGQAPLPKDGP